MASTFWGTCSTIAGNDPPCGSDCEAIYVPTSVALRACPAPGDECVYAFTQGALVAGDGGEGVWRWDEDATDDDNLGTVLLPAGHTGDGRWRRVRAGTSLETAWFGGITQEAIQATFTYQQSLGADGARGYFRITPGEYTITDEIDAHIPYAAETNGYEGWHVDARGVVFNFVGADAKIKLDRGDFDRVTGTSRRYHWLGGILIGDGTAGQVGIQAYFMRSMSFTATAFIGMDAGVRLWGLDTYTFRDCYFFDNDVSIDVPLGSSVQGSAPAVPDVTICLAVRDCHFSVSGMTSGIRIRSRLNNLIVSGGSFNGASTGPHIDEWFDDDDSGVFSMATQVDNVHFENFTTYPISMTVDASVSAIGNHGYHGVDLRNNFFRADLSAFTPDELLDLRGVRSISMEANAIFCTNATAKGVALFGESVRSVRWGAGNSAINMRDTSLLVFPSSAYRKYAHIEPAHFSGLAKNAPGFASEIVTATSANIDAWALVEDQYTQFALMPRGYDVMLRAFAADSAAAAFNQLQINVYSSDVGLNSGVSVNLAGNPNNRPTVETGFVAANSDGSIDFAATYGASGEATVLVQIRGVYF
jgi:hypothetical protein